MHDPTGLRVTLALSSFAEATAATDRLLALAMRRIDVFDATLDAAWNDPARLECVRAFCLGGARRELRIVLHDTTPLRTRCPRLVALLRTFAHVIAIHETRPEARHARDALVVVDGMHHLHRREQSRPKGTLSENAPDDTRPLAERFNEIWAASDPAVSATTLGL